MLATFVIGLREGLEAALIVSIIATFLKTNGKPLRPMWIGVVAAVLLSIAVGVVLKVIEESLPQAAQEGMETVIGAIAIVFVTGMVLWMTTHARFMKRELETAAREALSDGTSRALTLMAFLAVLKEGFETAVFLLATFQASSNTGYAATGAIFGICCAVLIGWGIFSGGVRLNLARFFKYTSAFLLLVAAGLVVSALRTAHEAHWLNAGQQRTIDLSWLAPTGSIRGALFTGVLGIPPDPRMIEVLGWLCYLVPMALILFWPQTHRPGAARSRQIKGVCAGALVVAAVVLFFAVPSAHLQAPARATVVDSSGTSLGTASLSTASPLALVLEPRSGSGEHRRLTTRHVEQHDGLTAIRYSAKISAAPARPSTLTLDQLLTYTGNRLPVGLDVSRNPGPFKATWSQTGSTQVWVVQNHLLDARQQRTEVLTISGGGLTTPRSTTVTPSGSALATSSWSVPQSYVDEVAHATVTQESGRVERDFWRHTVPLAMLIAAAALCLAIWRSTRQDPEPTTTPRSTPARAV